MVQKTDSKTNQVLIPLQKINNKTMATSYWEDFTLFLKKFKYKKLIIWLISIFVVLQILIFIFRTPLANYYVHKKADAFAKSHHAKVHIGDVEFKGLTGLAVSDIFIKPDSHDTLFTLQSAYVRLSFWKMLIFRVSLTDFELKKADLHLVRDTLGNNYDFLLTSDNEENSDTTEAEKESDDYNYSGKADGLLSLAFDLLPSNITINDFRIRTDLDKHHVDLFLPEFVVDDHKYSSDMTLTEEETLNHWRVVGVLNPDESQIKCKWFSTDTGGVVIPYLKHKFNTLISFDTIEYTLFQEEGSSSFTAITGNAAVNGLAVFNERISLEDVHLNNASIQYKINIGEDYIELDSSSSVVFNQLKFNPYLSYKVLPTKSISLKLHKGWFAAQQFFSSLPGGLFGNLQGMQVSGEMAYDLDAFVDFGNLDSLKFDSDLKKRNFKILHYGQTDLGKMNGTFPYTAYEHGVAVRTFDVGSSNPNFRALSQISDYLKNCILYSEDLGFFWHKGFSEGAFRSAIARNIKAKRFKVGGSTISQQLVKNVFLTRNKTIARKVEEALIVWLIENNRLSSKERMYEVYLNIIEWGPMVYGANEASQFYFGKDVSRLTLNEAIFLASIVPKPKWFRSSFDESGNLKPSLDGYYKNLAGRMLKNGIITQADFDGLIPNVELKGPAKNLVLVPDTLEMDSLEIEF